MTYSDLPALLSASLSPLYPDREIESIARLVLEHITGLSWVEIRLNQTTACSADEENLIRKMIVRLEKHEPIQYILGETEFFGLKLKVLQGVLIPRGETEELVDWIVKTQGSRLKARGTRHKAQGARRKAQGSLGSIQGEDRGPRLRGDDRKGVGGEGRVLRVLDIGCGSGAIAIAIAKYLPDAEVFAADISEEALELTRENAVLNGISAGADNYLPLHIFHLDILAPVKCGFFDLIVSNPPYVPLGEMTNMDLHVVEYEPETALFVPDHDPLLFYKAISEFARNNLNPGGKVFVEIHDRLGEETAEVFRKWFLNVELRKDIHGKDRMIRAYNG
ncbi:MAG: HemK/PrmC family methyltransferase [Bacteroidales bacterium]|jgi:release factor glutamine methyltransferase